MGCQVAKEEPPSALCLRSKLYVPILFPARLSTALDAFHNTWLSFSKIVRLSAFVICRIILPRYSLALNLSYRCTDVRTHDDKTPKLLPVNKSFV